MKDSHSSIIFFLAMEESLPDTYYVFDEILRGSGHILVPVMIDQLQSLASSTEQSHVVVLSSVTDFNEFNLFNKHIRKLLKFVLKSKRITFFQLSSFSKLDDSKDHVFRKNYFFVKYPVDGRVFLQKIIRYHYVKSEQNSTWPGGRRASLRPVTV